MTKQVSSVAFLLAVCVLLASSSHSHGPDRSRIDALAPVEVVAGSLRQPMGVAIAPSGTVVVSDRKAGVVYEIGAGGAQPLLTGLQRPVGLAFDGAGRLLVVEERAGRLLALEGGAVTVLAQGMRNPRWVAAGDDGTIYLSAQGLRSEHRHRGHHDEDDEDDDDRGRPGDVILRLGPTGDLAIWADGFEWLEGLLVQGQAVLAAAEGRTHDRRRHDAVFQVPVQADGSAGPVSRLTQAAIEKPAGLALDALGALYLSAERLGHPWTPAGVIGKVGPAGGLTRFAGRLEAPRGMALDGAGHLYVADGTGRQGRLLRFRAPAAPAVSAPAFTSESPVTLTGQTEPGARVDVVVADAIVASAVTSDGRVVLAVPLVENASNALTVYATAHEGRGLTGASTELTIVHDGVAPLVTGLQPANGAVLNTRQPAIGATFGDALAGVDPASALIRLDGASVTALAQVTPSGFAFVPAPLAEGGHTVFVQVADRAGNTASASAAFVVDVTGPSITGLTPADGATVTTARPAIGAGFDDALAGVDVASVRILLDGIERTPGATVTATGFSLDPGDLAAGAHAVSVSVADLAGNVTTAGATFTVALAPGGPFPPDPATVAPPVDPTVATTVGTATAFLYSGANPIQTGVPAGTIDPRRVAVLRGRVLGTDGAPLPGAVVRILNHSEFGQTLSRADGMFNLAVNGGGALTVSYEHAGFLPVQRTVETPWRDFAALPDVAMVALDPNVTTIDLAAGAPIQVARGSVVTDALGTRQLTLFFRQGTTARMVLPGGLQQPLSTLHVRATEYTVGPNALAAVPGSLPANVAFVTSAEYSVDEALAAGATEVRFSQPVINYTENILGIPVGDAVPWAFYDRARAVWTPADDGRVIGIVSITGGLADLDTDGDGLVDNGAALEIDDAERQQLALFYQPGQSLMRRLLPHFTPFG